MSVSGGAAFRRSVRLNEVKGRCNPIRLGSLQEEDAAVPGSPHTEERPSEVPGSRGQSAGQVHRCRQESQSLSCGRPASKTSTTHIHLLPAAWPVLSHCSIQVTLTQQPNRCLRSGREPGRQSLLFLSRENRTIPPVKVSCDRNYAIPNTPNDSM